MARDEISRDCADAPEGVGRSGFAVALSPFGSSPVPGLAALRVDRYRGGL